MVHKRTERAERRGGMVREAAREPLAEVRLEGVAGGIVVMTSTEAQNGFGHLLETVSGDRTVLITHRGRPRAAVVPMERYEALMRGGTPDLDGLATEFDALFARLGTSAVRAR